MKDLINTTETVEPTVSHKTIATMTCNQEQNVMNLINKYAVQLEGFGKVFFKTIPLASGQSGREAFLNEGQSTLLITFMRNNEIVIDFKTRLVREFMALKQRQPLSRLELAKEQVRLIEELEATKEIVHNLEVEIDESLEWSTIKRVEANIDIKCDWRVMKSVCTQLDVERRDVFDANYGTVKSYHRDAWMTAYSVDVATMTIKESS